MRARHTASPRRRTKRRFRVAIAAAAATAAGLATTTAAEAASLHSVAINTSASGGYLVLDVAYGSSERGAPVVQWPGHGGANQRWNVVELSNGDKRIISQQTGMCLTTNGIAGQPLYMWDCTLGHRQEWRGDLRNAFTVYPVKLRNPASGLVMDVRGASPLPGAPLIAWYANNNGGQGFSYYQLY